MDPVSVETLLGVVYWVLSRWVRYRPKVSCTGSPHRPSRCCSIINKIFSVYFIYFTNRFQHKPHVVVGKRSSQRSLPHPFTRPPSSRPPQSSSFSGTTMESSVLRLSSRSHAGVGSADPAVRRVLVTSWSSDPHRHRSLSLSLSQSLCLPLTLWLLV